MASGSAAMLAASVAVGRAAPAGRCPESSRESPAAKIAPKIATPTEPPIDRNSVAPEVATPRWR